MTTRYTNEEWATIIARVEKGVVVSQEPYPYPQIGSPAFAKAIDHSLLKLVAREVQFDDLCAEARVQGFAVSSHDRCSANTMRILTFGRLFVYVHMSWQNASQTSKAPTSRSRVSLGSMRARMTSTINCSNFKIRTSSSPNSCL